MSRSQSPRPTDAELGILRVLWERGPCTVREVHQVLSEGDEAGVGYTTVLKLLQIMNRKQLVERDTSERAHVFRACCSEQETQGQLIDHLVNGAFGGSAAQLVLRALSETPATAEELDQSRRTLDQLGDESTEDASIAAEPQTPSMHVCPGGQSESTSQAKWPSGTVARHPIASDTTLSSDNALMGTVPSR